MKIIKRIIGFAGVLGVLVIKSLWYFPALIVFGIDRANRQFENFRSCPGFLIEWLD